MKEEYRKYHLQVQSVYLKDQLLLVKVAIRTGWRLYFLARLLFFFIVTDGVDTSKNSRQKKGDRLGFAKCA